MLRHMSLCALAAAAPEMLPTDTTLPYTELRTTGFVQTAGYEGALRPQGTVRVTEGELNATYLNINIQGVDSLCPDNRTADPLPDNGCSIYVDLSMDCDNLQGPYFNRQATIIDPWRKGNYGWNVMGGGKPQVVGFKVLAGTGMGDDMLRNQAIVVHDSDGRAYACGKIGQDITSSVELSKVQAYTGSVQFEAGTVQVTVLPTKVQFLNAIGEDGSEAGITGADQNCTKDYNNGNPIPVSGCGIQVYDAVSCDGDANEHFFNSNKTGDGNHDPWLEVRYAVTTNPTDGSVAENTAAVKSPQPVFTATDLSSLNTRALILHDAAGNKVACSTLAPWGDVPDYSTTTTSAIAEDSSSIPWWGILLIALAGVLVLGGIAAAFLCGGEKKRGLKKKKSSKKRAVQPEEQTLVNEPAPQPSVAPQPVYANPVYTTVSHALPVYAAPAATYAAPAVTYAHQAFSSGSVLAAPAAHYAAPVATYASPVATYQPSYQPQYQMPQ